MYTYKKIILTTRVLEVFPTSVAKIVDQLIDGHPSIKHIIDLHESGYDSYFYSGLFISFHKRKEAGQSLPIRTFPKYSELALDTNFRDYKQFLLEEYFQRSSTGEFDKYTEIKSTGEFDKYTEIKSIYYDNAIAYFNLLLRNSLFVDWQFPKGIPWDIGFVFNLK
jgi:hypothetical protein